jgi:uncharacterized protein YdaU (DUF1376 family)
MAALPYMQLYVSDYLADTMHLDTEQHGAYLLLIMNYWQTAKPIPKNRLQAITRVSNDRWSSVELSLNEYFNDTGTHWVHSRIDADIKMVEEAQAQRSSAGKASAEAKKRLRQAQLKRNGNEKSTVVEVPLQRSHNENSSKENRLEENRIEENIKDTKALKRSVFKPPTWMPEEKWKSYLNTRRSKKHPMNAEALELCTAAIDKTITAGVGVDEILERMIETGWRTVKPEWFRDQALPAANDNAALAKKTNAMMGWDGNEKH